MFLINLFKLLKSVEAKEIKQNYIGNQDSVTEVGAIDHDDGSGGFP